MTQTKTESYA